MLLRLLCLALFVAFAASSAHAGEAFAVLVEVTARDVSGRWRATDLTLRAWVERGERRLPASRDLPLEPGDRVVTEDARLRIVLGKGEELVVREHSDVEVRERTALQRAGEVYYSLRDAFSVQYGSVQTTVEGTEFVVSGAPGLVRVTVVEGRVRVNNGAGDVRVTRWQSVDLPNDPSRTTPPDAPPPKPRSRPDLAREAVNRTFTRRTELGLLVGGGLDNGGGATSARAFARFPLAGPLRLAVDSGLGTNGASTGLRLPEGLGLEADFGGWAVSAQAVATIELDRLSCDGAYTALHVGGTGALRTSLPLSRRIRWTGAVRGGWVQGPVADVAIGLSVSP